jgi:peptide/nickel transport system permease protein
MRRNLGYGNVRGANSWPINNRPQVNNLPHIEVPAPIGGVCFNLPASEALTQQLSAPATARYKKSALKIGRQLGGLLATTLIGGFLTAALVRHSPGFDADERDLDARLSVESRASIRAEHAAQQNVRRFYVRQMAAALHGDFGVSPSLQQPIGQLIAARLPVTLELMALGVGSGWTLAFALALASVLWRGSAVSRLAGAVSTCALCMPSAAMAVLMFVVGGPVRAIIALVLFPRLYETLRNLLQDAYERPHILTARAKGVGPASILLRHVMPVCAPEFLALAGVSAIMAFGAAIPVETLCDLPGLGQLAWKAAIARDLPLLTVLTLLITLLTQLCNAAADWVTA